MNSFTISRTFNAPRNQVFSCWTTPDRFENWFAPDECETKLIHADATPGGHFLQSDKWPDGSHFFIKHVYRQVEAEERIAFVTSFCNENGEIVRHPHAALWPEKILTTANFDQDGAGTKVTVVLEPIEASTEEIAFFTQIRESCLKGWSGTFDRLERVIRTLAPHSSDDSSNPDKSR